MRAMTLLTMMMMKVKLGARKTKKVAKVSNPLIPKARIISHLSRPLPSEARFLKNRLPTQTILIKLIPSILQCLLEKIKVKVPHTLLCFKRQKSMICYHSQRSNPKMAHINIINHFRKRSNPLIKT